MLAVAALWVGLTGALQHASAAPEMLPTEPAGSRDMPEGAVYLYFADPQTGFLAGEMRQIDPAPGALAFYRQVMDELIHGPNRELMPTIPPETKLRALYLDRAGIVYVDISGRIAEAHPGGVRSELLTVYSIVNTLVLNADGVAAVKILINGNEADTLAGHVDISLPLKAQMLLVR